MKQIKFVGLALLLVGLWSGLHDDMAYAKKKSKKSEKKGASSGKGKDYQPPYGMAGCGLGSVIISNDGMIQQVLAATSNGTSSNQLFAITSGTSNCAATKEDVAMMEQEVFIAANLNSLEKDVARGHGDYLYAWSEVLGCRDVYKSFTAESNSHYHEIFSDLEPNQVLDRYLKVIRSHEDLGASCLRVAHSKTS